MKVFALLFIIGCAFANHQSEYRWQSGKQHVFEYSGRLLTGIPQLASHYSGLGINATVLVDVVNQNELQLSLENARFAKVNQRLEARLFAQDGRDGANWREVLLPQMSQADSEISKILEQPIVFQLEQGEIRQAKISRSEPEWSVNFKKALALLFQTKVDAAAWRNEENQIRSSQSDNFWQTTEQGIDGICQVTYQVNELPRYMIRDRPDLIPYPEQCQGQQQYYEIIKSKDVNNCERRSAFQFHQPGRFRCQGPNCKNMWARTSETRIIACGARGNLQIQTIVNQGELNQNLLGFKTERFVSGNMQILRLKEVRSASPKPQPQDQITVNNMMYEYTQESYQNQQNQQELKKRQSRVPLDVLKDAHKLAKVLPQAQMQGQKSVLSSTEVKQQVKTLMQQVIRQASNPQTEILRKSKITMNILSAARGISMLKKFDIESLYQQLKSEFSQDQIHKDTTKKLFIDVVLMSGTPEAVRFLKEQIEKNELTTVETFTIFLQLPNNLMFPTQQILEEIFQLVQSQKIQESRALQNVATMSFSTLLEKACMSNQRETSYPSWVMGSFCSPSSPVVQEKFLPYLYQQLQSAQSWERRNEIIVAIGMLPIQQNIGKLVPYLEGKVQQQEVPKMTRLLTLWSLATAGAKQSQTIEPILYSLYANPAESTEIRISAFNALMKINPSAAVFQKIAARTWTEQDREVLRAVNSALYSLSLQHQQQASVLNTQTMDLASKAKMTYPMVKKVSLAMWLVSSSVYNADYLPAFQTGYQGVQSWIASQKSFIPQDVYVQLTYFLGQFQFMPFAIGYRMHGAENIYRNLAQLLAPTKSGQSTHEQKEEIAKQIKESLNSQWRKIVEELNIKSRDQDNKISAAGFLRLQEQTPFFGNFNEMTVEALKEKINEIFQDPQSLKNKIQNGEHRFNVKKTFDASPYIGLIATDMGLPLTIELHMPFMVSMESKIKVDSIWPKPQLKAETRAFYTSQYVAWVGTQIPFTKEYAVTAFDDTMNAQLPTTIKLNIDIPSQQVQLSVQLNEQQQQKIDMVYHHTYPFTAIQKTNSLTPITQEQTIIRSQDQLKTRQNTIGESLGLHMSYKLETESRWVDLKSVFERLSKFNYSPKNMVLFSWASFGMNSQSQPSMRQHQFALTIDPSQSSTKELSFNLKFGVASKQSESETTKYYKVKVLSETEQKKEAEEEQDIVMKQIKKLVPLSYESESLESKHSHPKRQEKLEQMMKKVMESSSSSSKKISAQAVTVRLSATIKGSRAQTWSYLASVARSYRPEPQQRKAETKYSVELENEQTKEKAVVKGRIQSPVLPLWSIHAIRASMIDYNAFTSVQYVHNEQKQWSIDVDTKAQTTHEQKEYSRVSPQAKQCQKLQEQKESGIRPVIAQLSEACQAMRHQARALDNVQISIKYNNVPQYIERYEAKTIEVFKTLMWPFLKMDSEIQQSSSSAKHSIKSAPVYARIQFHRRSPSFDLTIERPQEKLQFRQIRLPSPLNEVLPLKAGINNIKWIAQKASNHALYPVCKVEGKSFRTFDNRTLPLYLDQCFHVVAADCSKQQQYAVMARKTQQSSEEKEIKIYLGQHEVRITPQQSQLKVYVNNQEQTVQQNQWQPLRTQGQQQQRLGQIFLAQNNVVQISAPYYSLALTFDGQNIAVESSQWLKGQQCGICGNQNQQSKDELEGPQFCMYSQAEIQNAAWRVQNLPQGCDQKQPLSQTIRQKLQEQNQQCHKRHSIKTKISKSLKAQNGPCTILKHAVIRRPNQICLSKKQVTQCAAGCQPSHAQLLEKQIPFNCMKNDRVAQHYVQKAERGEKLPELQQRPTTFETKVPQPRTCVPASNEL